MSEEQKDRTTKDKPTSFEDALSRLELIVQELESKELSLEETLARYEEGSCLVQECRRRLEDAEQRIRAIARGSDHGPNNEPDSHETGENEPSADLPF